MPRLTLFNAAEALIKLEAREARLLGLDMPTKVDRQTVDVNAGTGIAAADDETR
jgi:hypothetical protein